VATPPVYRSRRRHAAAPEDTGRRAPGQERCPRPPPALAWPAGPQPTLPAAAASGAPLRTAGAARAPQPPLDNIQTAGLRAKHTCKTPRVPRLCAVVVTGRCSRRAPHLPRSMLVPAHASCAHASCAHAAGPHARRATEAHCGEASTHACSQAAPPLPLPRPLPARPVTAQSPLHPMLAPCSGPSCHPDGCRETPATTAA
jgi:hypothetical protein